MEIKDWRARLGLTQSAAAAALGITLRWYQFLEAGKRSDGQRVEPDLTTRLAMAALEAGLAPLGEG